MSDIHDLERRIRDCAKKHKVLLPVWVKSSDVHPMQNIAGRMFKGKDKHGKLIVGIWGSPHSGFYEIERHTLFWRFYENVQ